MIERLCLGLFHVFAHMGEISLTSVSVTAMRKCGEISDRDIAIKSCPSLPAVS